MSVSCGRPVRARRDDACALRVFLPVFALQNPFMTLAVERTSTGSSNESSTSLPSGAGVTFSPASVNGSSAVDVHSVEWGSNPHSWSDTASPSSSVLSVNLFGGGGDEITSVPVPIVLSMVVPPNTTLELFQCGYWDTSFGALWPRARALCVCVASF